MNNKNNTNTCNGSHKNIVKKKPIAHNTHQYSCPMMYIIKLSNRRHSVGIKIRTEEVWSSPKN